MASAVLTWPASPASEQVDSYNVEQSTDGGVTWGTLGNTLVPTFTVPNLAPTPYLWRVRAHNVAGFSVPSEPVASPDLPTPPGPVELVIEY